MTVRCKGSRPELCNASARRQRSGHLKTSIACNAIHRKPKCRARHSTASSAGCNRCRPASHIPCCQPSQQPFARRRRSHETPIRFGPDNRCSASYRRQPVGRDAKAHPRPLLINTSANPRWGNARIAVDIARGLAADGIASLRMDASGIGDTALQTGETGRPYSEALTRDVVHAVAVAQRTQRRVLLYGGCSAAYHALQAAYRDSAASGLILVNLQRFVWREGDPSDIVRRSALRPTRFYLRNILTAQAWLRLLRADFDVANLIRVFAARMVRRAVAAIDPAINLLSRRPTQVRLVRRSGKGSGNAASRSFTCWGKMIRASKRWPSISVATVNA